LPIWQFSSENGELRTPAAGLCPQLWLYAKGLYSLHFSGTPREIDGPEFYKPCEAFGNGNKGQKLARRVQRFTFLTIN
jgi:hypothetical protein